MMVVMRNTIKNHNDFTTDRSCPYVTTDLFVIRTRPAKYENDARYGLVVAKRNFRFAVERNRAKRLLRDWIAFSEQYMCDDLDYVFFARANILGDSVTREIGRNMMVNALQDIKLKNESRKK